MASAAWAKACDDRFKRRVGLTPKPRNGRGLIVETDSGGSTSLRWDTWRAWAVACDLANLDKADLRAVTAHPNMRGKPRKAVLSLN